MQGLLGPQLAVPGGPRSRVPREGRVLGGWWVRLGHALLPHPQESPRQLIEFVATPFGTPPAGCLQFSQT